MPVLRLRSPTDAFWNLPTHFVPVCLPSYKQYDPTAPLLAGGVRICDLVVTNPAYRQPRLNHMPKDDVAIAEIKALEDRRYSAMLAGDMALLDELCSDDLIYTHSKADYDDKRSYLHKVGSRYFTYLEITHPADHVLVVDGAALALSRCLGTGAGRLEDR